MERRDSLALEAWKAVARHAAIQDVLDSLSIPLTRDLAGAALRVRAIDPARSTIETIASLGRTPVGGREDLGSGDWQRLAAWSATGEIARGTARRFAPASGP